MSINIYDDKFRTEVFNYCQSRKEENKTWSLTSVAKRFDLTIRQVELIVDSDWWQKQIKSQETQLRIEKKLHDRKIQRYKETNDTSIEAKRAIFNDFQQKFRR